MVSLRLFVLILFTGLLAAGCSVSKNKVTVLGDLKGMPEQTVMLEELSLDGTATVIDSAKSTGAGTFELAGAAPQPGLYRLRFSADQAAFVLLSLDGGSARVAGDWARLAEHRISGSPASSSLQGFVGEVRDFTRDFETLNTVMDSLRAQGKDTLRSRAEQDLKDRNFRFTRYVEQYADTTKYLPNAVFAAALLNPESEKDYLGTFVKNLGGRFPSDAALAQQFTARYQQMTSRDAVQQQYGSGPAVGVAAPPIEAAMPSGAKASLASLRGKYVLVDFWASWCGPCRAENPNVVAAFQKFQGKNFTVLGVSLDSDGDKWKKAIADDGLAWTQISDLQGWESIAARDYAVQSIPTNFLVDPDGKIVARDLRGPALEAKLAEVLQ